MCCGGISICGPTGAFLVPTKDLSTSVIRLYCFDRFFSLIADFYFHGRLTIKGIYDQSCERACNFCCSSEGLFLWKASVKASSSCGFIYFGFVIVIVGHRRISAANGTSKVPAISSSSLTRRRCMRTTSETVFCVPTSLGLPPRTSVEVSM
jgi:hypothetical protein